MEEKDGTWYDELKKYVGKEVVVSYMKGTGLVEVTGIVKAFQFNYLHVLLIVGDRKIIIKNFVDMSRKRNA